MQVKHFIHAFFRLGKPIFYLPERYLSGQHQIQSQENTVTHSIVWIIPHGKTYRMLSIKNHDEQNNFFQNFQKNFIADFETNNKKCQTMNSAPLSQRSFLFYALVWIQPAKLKKSMS